MRTADEASYEEPSALASKAGFAIEHAKRFEPGTRSVEELTRLLEAERSARVECERVNAMKDDFLATLAHELRTPLYAVMGWAELLLSKSSDTPVTHRGLEAIARSTRAQAKLIDDLLDTNAIASGKIRLDPHHVDLASTVESALDAIRPAAEAKGIALRSTFVSPLGHVLADPHRLQQMLSNLLTNAVKFTPQGGQVDIRVSCVHSDVEIVVSDNGAGIRREFLPHVFERFQQGSSLPDHEYRGLGLGLSLVKQLVELHGGSVDVESAGVGKGACFTLHLHGCHIEHAGSPRENASTTGERPIARRRGTSLRDTLPYPARLD